jgi:hypothetical protein
MLKSAFNVSPSLDVNIFYIWKKLKLEQVIDLKTVSCAMVNFAITPELRIGYAYDHIISDLKVTSPSSHEFIILYDLFTPKRFHVHQDFSNINL